MALISCKALYVINLTVVPNNCLGKARAIVYESIICPCIFFSSRLLVLLRQSKYWNESLKHIFWDIYKGKTIWFRYFVVQVDYQSRTHSTLYLRIYSS